MSRIRRTRWDDKSTLALILQERSEGAERL